MFVSTYQSVLMVQMKNWDPLVLGPAFAIDKIPKNTGNLDFDRFKNFDQI